MSSRTPPMNRFVSRLRPSVPRGLSPSMWGSLSTLSIALRRLRVTTSWCQRPWVISTLLISVPVPEPVLNLRRENDRLYRTILSLLYLTSNEFTELGEVIYLTYLIQQTLMSKKKTAHISQQDRDGWKNDGTGLPIWDSEPRGWNEAVPPLKNVFHSPFN